MSDHGVTGHELDLALEPRRLGDGSVAFDVEEIRVTLTPRAGGWDYARPGLARPIHVGQLPDGVPRFVVRVPAGEAVARFASSLFVPRDDAIDAWVAWPLEVAVLCGDGVEIDSLAPRRRRTVLGTVSDGRVLDAAVCEAVAGPYDPALAGRPLAALAVRVRNLSGAAAAVNRAPLFGGSLALHRRERSLAVVGVRVHLSAEGHAEATTKPGPPPEGFRVVAEARAAQDSHLGWLLDQTRRSVEFPL